MHTKNKVAFCFSFTPLQSMILSNLDFKEYNKIYIINTSKRKVIINHHRVVNVVNSKSLLIRAFKLFMYVLMYRRYKKIDKELYLAHPHSELVNDMFFSRNTKSIYLIEDGIANYYEPNVPLWVKDKIEKRLVLLKYFGFGKYKDCAEFFCREFVKRVYASYPDLVSDSLKDKVVKLKLEYSLNEHLSNDTILIIDQYVDETRLAIDRIVDGIEIELMKYKYIFYKKHHDGGFIYRHVNKTVRDKFIFLGDEKSAEEFFVQLRPQCVISLFSSALINIKSISSSVIILGYSSRDFTIERNGKVITMEKFFKIFGIHLNEL